MMPREQATTLVIRASSPKAERSLQGVRSYLRRVQAHSGDNLDVYMRFIGILEDYKSGIINVHGAIRCICQLFRGNSDLIQGSSIFLPLGYRVEWTAYWDPVRATTPTRTTSESSKRFTFFQLPAELRIQIYNEALIKLVKLRPPNDGRPLQLVVYAKDFADPNLRLVSKQFRDEYMSEAEKKTILVVEDAPGYKWTFVRVPRNIQYVRTLEVYVRTVCCPCFVSLHSEPTLRCSKSEIDMKPLPFARALSTPNVASCLSMKQSIR